LACTPSVSQQIAWESVQHNTNPLRIFMKKKTKPKKTPDPFKLLVMALEKKTQLPDTAGKGVVKGNDVASMKDILEQGSKDA
tara:strand:+ start:258 stop:503 length:246 start_codon:yes stop_codon:yes gene_type:complete